VSAAARIMLCADDFALTEGVSRGIGELVAAGRLSAASALVTTRHWPAHAGSLRALREKIAVGLHVNLTLGRPLAAMPGLCPDGRFPPIGRLAWEALRARLIPAEIATEIGRQLTAFEQALGSPPDFIDGHQHAHVLPGVRRAFLAAVSERVWVRRPLIRDPSDSPAAIAARGAAVPKSMTIAALALGFGKAVRSAGFPTNHGFSGVSAFDVGRPYASEFARFVRVPGRRHLVMCHPGHVDAELPALDPVSERRAEELAALMAYPNLPSLIWHPERSVSDVIDWGSLAGTHG